MLRNFRKFGFLISALLFLSVLFLNPSASAQSQRPLPAASTGYVPGEVIVKLKSPSEGSLQKDYQLTSLEKILKQHRLKDKGLDRLILVKQKAADVSQLVERLKKDPRVEYAEPNFTLHATLIPNDPFFSNLWGLQNSGQTGGTNDADIDAPEAWDIARDTNLVVGVIDTGVDYTHEDLKDNLWINQAEASGSAGVDDDGNGFVDDVYGYDFVNNDPDPMDDYGHGTHVAGTIAAKGNNWGGVTGVNWNGQIAALKFLDSSGYGSTVAAINALTYANQMGFKITSNSWGGAAYSQALSDTISAANDLGYLFVASAGNNSVNTDAHPSYPSSYNLPNIISVSATDHNDQLATFSNWGPTSVDLGAPGANIYSTVPKGSCSLCNSTGYKFLSGTSMAAPHVSGAAALLWSYLPNLNHLEIKDRILTTVDPVSPLNYKVVSHGRLNLSNALSNTTLPAPPPLNNVVFSDNFEATTSGWVTAGNVGTGSTAPQSLWHLSQRRSQSPQTAWYYGRESTGNYDTGSANWGTLTSADIDLTNNQNSTLTFYHFLATENLSTNANPFYDEASVKVSTDGVNWTKVQSYGGGSGAWVKETVDLSSFDGQVIKIQFSFDTKDAILNNFEGWFVDDVQVLGSTGSGGPGPTPTPTPSPTPIQLLLLTNSVIATSSAYLIQYEWSPVPAISTASLMIWNGDICKTATGGYNPGDLAQSVGIGLSTKYYYSSPTILPGNKYCAQLWEDFYAGKAYSNTTSTLIPSTYNVFGTVFVDQNKDGVKNPAELGFESAKVAIGVGYSTLTDGSGLFNLTNIPSGSYPVGLTIPQGYGSTTPNPVSVNLPPSAQVDFGITDIELPGVTLNSPLNEASVSGTIVIQSEAQDNEAIKEIELLADGVQKHKIILTTPSKTFYYGPSLDTTTLTNGVHLLTVRATDISGNVGSSSVSVYIKNLNPVFNGAITYWKMDEIFGPTLFDSFGNYSATGSDTISTIGKLGNGRNFNGLTSSVNAGSPFAFDNIPQLSVSAWIYPKSEGESARGVIIAKAAGGNWGGWFLRFAPSGTNALLFESQFTKYMWKITANNAIKLNSWNHVVLTWDGSANAGNVHIYVNGVEATYAITQSGSGSRADDSLANLLIGDNTTGFASFDGTIDETGVWNRILSAPEVTTLYNNSSGLTP